MSNRSRAWDEPNPASLSATTPPAPAVSAQEAAERAAAIAAKLANNYAKPAPKREKEDFDGEFTHDIEINDLRNRYLLTKGSTQTQLHQETGASITTKGTWLPDKSKATAAEPPLYLHIVATSQEILDGAVKKVNDLIAADLGPLVEDRSQWGRNRERFGNQIPASGANGAPVGGGEPDGGAPPAEQAGGRFGGRPGERRKWPEEKVPIGLESLRNFNVRAKVVGPGGLFVKHIQAETGTRVQIKGLGSGFYDQETGRESEDPMHVSISGPDESQVEKAKLLAEDLLLVVRSEWAKARDAQQLQQGVYSGFPMQNYYVRLVSSLGCHDAPPPPPDSQSAGGPPSSAPPAAAPVAEDPQEAYRKYWATYGYDVNDPAFQAWQAQQYSYYQQPGATGAAAGAAGGAAVGYGAQYAQSLQQPQAAQQQQAPSSTAPQGAHAESASGGSGIYGAVPPPPNL
ncbi:Predicted RNA-binding protein, contains KH domains [Phaffia rhodozyma]|uniref:Predicted RNA-binding protein, contains KH domains n=1 Tax=Phaffia rhodozyma TaxID=264483 RepID=A0A0F7SUE3_PHARH|nr:Predicted RNA-binding protein, contains KH domains [Phaffia rhodozyma]